MSRSVRTDYEALRERQARAQESIVTAPAEPAPYIFQPGVEYTVAQERTPEGQVRTSIYDPDGKLAQVQVSCPTRITDGRNELRCWFPAGHEGECR